jgi:hypothetical protein
MAGFRIALQPEWHRKVRDMFKTPSLLSAFAVFTSLPLSAITEADLAPEALAGKTLTFTIATGAAPFATNGTWTGAFGTAPGNSFKMTNVSGNTVNNTGTWSYNSTFAGMYEYTLKPFIAGQPDGYLTLWISEGAGRYEVYLDGLFGNSQTGGFTIGSAPKSPEIGVQQPVGSNLSDNAGRKGFGTAKIGGKGNTKTFTIQNTGTAKLTGLKITKNGANQGDFKVGLPGAVSLAPGASTTFKVTFKPTAAGTRKAAIHIESNDADENPFDIKLGGEGVK